MWYLMNIVIMMIAVEILQQTDDIKMVLRHLINILMKLVKNHNKKHNKNLIWRRLL